MIEICFSHGYANNLLLCRSQESKRLPYQLWSKAATEQYLSSKPLFFYQSVSILKLYSRNLMSCFWPVDSGWKSLHVCSNVALLHQQDVLLLSTLIRWPSLMVDLSFLNYLCSVIDVKHHSSIASLVLFVCDYPWHSYVSLLWLSFPYQQTVAEASSSLSMTNQKILMLMFPLVDHLQSA